MKKEASWGGNIEIQAFADLFNVNIIIHMLNQIPYIISRPTATHAIHISYHDGNHYNSVRWEDDINDNIPREIPSILQIIHKEEVKKEEIIPNEEEKIITKKLVETNSPKILNDNKVNVNEIIDYTMMILSIPDREIVKETLKNIYKSEIPSLEVF